jgi:hypothetical protein
VYDATCKFQIGVGNGTQRIHEPDEVRDITLREAATPHDGDGRGV